MRTALILMALALVGCATCGCKGGLFGGRMNPGADDLGKGTIKVYEINVSPNARSIINIGNAGQNVPMYQQAETAGDPTAPYYTGGEMPASGSQNAGTAQGKYVIQSINDGVKRSSETDAAMAAALQAGVTGSTLGQTAPTGQRQGQSTGTGGAAAATTTTTDTTSVPISAAVAPGGVAIPSVQSPQQSPSSTQNSTPSGTVTQPAATGTTGTTTP